MASSDEVVTATVKIRGDITDLASALRSNTNLSAKEAQRMEVAIKKSFLKNEQAVKAYTKALDDLNKKQGASTSSLGKLTGQQSASLKNLSSQLADIGKGLASGTSPLTILTQQGDQVVGALSGLGPLFPMIAGGLAVVGGAVLLGGGIWAAYKEEVGAAKAATEKVRLQNEALIPVLDDAREAEVRYAVAVGALTEEQGKQAQASLKAGNAMRDAMKGSSKDIADIQKQMHTFGVVVATVLEDVARHWGFLAQADLIDSFTVDQEELKKQTTAAAEALVKQSVATLHQTHATLAAKVAEDKAAKAKEAHETAAKRLREQLALLNDAIDTETKTAEANVKTYHDAVASIDAVSKSRGREVSETQAADNAHRERLATIDAELRQAMAAAGTAETIAAAQAAAQQAQLRSTEEFYAQLRAMKAAEAAAEAKARGADMREQTKLAQTEIEAKGEADSAAIKSRLAAQQDATAALFGSSADAFGLMVSEMEGLSKKQALTLFGLQKAAQMAQAALLVPSAILQGLAQAGPLGGIAAGVAGGIQIAAIAAADPPAFSDTPGMMQMGQQGGVVKFKEGDVFAAAQDPAKLAQQVGAGGAGGATTVQLMLSGRTLQAVTVYGQNRPGAARKGSATTKPGRKPPRSR